MKPIPILLILSCLACLPAFGQTWTVATANAGQVNYVPALPPAISVQPVALLNVTNTVETFTVTASGTAPLAYQWHYGATGAETNVPNATASSFATNSYPVTTAQTNNVFCVITNASGSVTSATVTAAWTNSLTPIVAHVLLDFETSTDNTVITPTIFTNSMKGAYAVWESLCYINPDAFTEGSTTNLMIETDAAHASHSPYSILGTTYSTAGTRGMRATHYRNECLGFWEPGDVGYAPISLGFFWRWNGSPTNDSPRDIIRMQDGGGNYLVFQCYDDASSPYAPYFHAHTNPNNGNNVTIARNTWYWITMLYVSGTGTAKISAYSTADWTLVGESTRTQTSGTTKCKTIQIGSCVYSIAGESYDFDNFLINTNGTYPLGP